jgi:ABC-type uncharacterized transport system auxiliary subunit
MRVRVLVLLAVLPGCALFSKGEVPMRRYFSPDFPAAGPASTAPTEAGRELRLGRVTAGGAIGERIMFRASEHEVGFYDDWSWTEKPQAHLRRGLSHVLFEEKGLRSTLGGSGPMLEVELIRFEEVRTPVHLGRVKLAFSLSDERLVSLQQTLTVERPIPATDARGLASAVAGAMGEALRDAIDEVSTRVAAELEKAPMAQAPCPSGATAQKR